MAPTLAVLGLLVVPWAGTGDIVDGGVVLYVGLFEILVKEVVEVL